VVLAIVLSLDQMTLRIARWIRWIDVSTRLS
jgi:hypothetical protein